MICNRFNEVGVIMVKRIGVKNNHKFDGKWFTYKDTVSGKGEADRILSYWRRQGFNARKRKVSSTTGTYDLFIRG